MGTGARGNRSIGKEPRCTGRFLFEKIRMTICFETIAAAIRAQVVSPDASVSCLFALQCIQFLLDSVNRSLQFGPKPLVRVFFEQMPERSELRGVKRLFCW